MWNDDFWNKLAEDAANDQTVPSAVDQRIQSKPFGEAFESVRTLTDASRAKSAIELPVAKGTKVVFAGSLGAVLSLENPPPAGMEGEVVTVRSANGDITSHDGKVFVKWADGEFRPVHAEFLRPSPPGRTRRGGAVHVGDPTDRFGRVSQEIAQIRVASLGDLSSFLKVANDGSTLIHRSTKELWSFNKDADGGFTVSRMWDDNGEPLKG